MHSRLVRLLGTAAATVTAVVVGATTAFAQQTITVHNLDPSGSFYAAADHVLFGIVECTSMDFVPASEMTGSLPSGSYTAPAIVGWVETLPFNNCNGPLGSMPPQAVGLPYGIRVDTYEAATGRATLYITDMHVHVSMPGCAYDVVGDAPGVYDNASGQLRMGAAESGPSLLTPINIVGCFGFVNPGDEVPFVADYDVSPNITITGAT